MTKKENEIKIPSHSENDETEFERERRMLLEEVSELKKEDCRKLAVCIALWAVVFSFAMGGIIYVAVKKDLQEQAKEIVENQNDHYFHQWNPNGGISMCQNLERQEMIFYNEINNENISSFSFKSPSVFFLKDDSEMTFEESCCLESFARLMAELPVYSLQLKCNRGKSYVVKGNLRRILSQEYKNLVVLSVDGRSYFKHTPLHGRWACGDESALQEAVVLTAWRYGGLAVSPRVAITQRSFINFPIGQVHLNKHFVASYTKCSVPLYYLLNIVASRPKRKDHLDLNSMAKEAFDTLCCSGICPDVVTNETKVCDQITCPLVILNITKGYLKPYSSICPRTWKAVDEQLRAPGGTI